MQKAQNRQTTKRKHTYAAMQNKHKIKLTRFFLIIQLLQFMDSTFKPAKVCAPIELMQGVVQDLVVVSTLATISQMKCKGLGPREDAICYKSAELLNLIWSRIL